MVDEKDMALDTARNWNAPEDTIWTDGSRLEGGSVGAACVWREGETWSGHRFFLGNNKEVFDAETFAIYQALRSSDESLATTIQCSPTHRRPSSAWRTT